MINPEQVVLISLTKEQLQNIISEAVNNALTKYRTAAKERELLSADELCKWLGISISTLNVWKRDHKIPFKRLGKRVFFSRAEVLGALKDSNYYKLRELSKTA